MPFQFWVTVLVAPKVLPLTCFPESRFLIGLCLLCKCSRVPHSDEALSSLEDTLKDAEITEEIAQEFETIASQYVTAVIN